MSVSKIVSIFMLFIMLVGCATPYQGSGPNLNAKGKDAQIEIDKFTLGDSFWTQNKFGFHMGPKQDFYTVRSIEPIIDQISPNAKITLEKSRKIYFWSLIGLVLAIGSTIEAASTPVNSTQNSWWTGAAIGTWGTALGLSIYGVSVRLDAIRQYNEDLTKHFSPTIGWTKKFP